MKRWILHIDMDAFYASVEQLDDPEIKGKPVIVGGLSSRGVVSTASYEARRFGVHSAMPMAKAKILCPNAVFISPDHKKYMRVSQKVHEILNKYSPIIEPLSLDEAFLDLSGMNLLFSDVSIWGEKLQAEIKTVIGLDSSIGIAPNKFLAKFASDYKKPLGFMIIRQEEAAALLAPLPVKYLYGIGKVTLNKLNTYGINTIGTLKAADKNILKTVFGNKMETYLLLADGIDDRVVENMNEAKSIGREDTFDVNINTLKEAKEKFLALAQEVGWRLRHKCLGGHTLSIKVRFDSFETITRNKSSDYLFYYDEDIYKAAIDLFGKVFSGKPMRLLGITVSKLMPYENNGFLLTDNEEKQQKITDIVDKLKIRFGEDTILRGLIKNKKNEK